LSREPSATSVAAGCIRIPWTKPRAYNATRPLSSRASTRASTIRKKLRRIRYVDPETNKRFVFLTNNHVLPALIIALLYRARWHVELFFKWIKQHLRIKAFYGTSENAVKTEIWIAIAVYVLVAIVKKRLNLSLSLYAILQILSVALFEKTLILQVLSQDHPVEDDEDVPKQLFLLE